MAQPHWYDDAACVDKNFDYFTNDYWEIKACVLTCARCPVRVKCLTYALDHSIEHGIWGGVKGHTLALLRDYRKRGRHVKQLEDTWTQDWAPFGEWEELTGWDYPSGVGRGRGDGYSCLEKN
jgi:WhiB family redox-sensing transcriptional regulator